MGISRTDKGLSVVTTSRFKTKATTQLYFNRLMLHELGHAFGLNHCSDKNCIMVDAKGKNQFGHTPSFCSRCKEFLGKKNWKFDKI